MQELRLVAVSEDGTYLVLATAGRGTRFTLPVDDRLRAAVRGNFSRLGQYEIEVESPLRPKEIQARIRAGETAEEIAATAGIPVERVRWFEGPVLQEREYMAQQAQRVSIRIPGETMPGPTLGELVAERLTRRGVPADEIDWDSCKRDDNLWRVRLGFVWNGHTRHAEWLFDPRRRHITPNDEEAMRLSAAEYTEPVEEETTVRPLLPRLAPKLAPVSSPPDHPLPPQPQLPRPEPANPEPSPWRPAPDRAEPGFDLPAEPPTPQGKGLDDPAAFRGEVISAPTPVPFRLPDPPEDEPTHRGVPSVVAERPARPDHAAEELPAENSASPSPTEDGQNAVGSDATATPGGSTEPDTIEHTANSASSPADGESTQAAPPVVEPAGDESAPQPAVSTVPAARPASDPPAGVRKPGRAVASAATSGGDTPAPGRKATVPARSAAAGRTGETTRETAKDAKPEAPIPAPPVPKPAPPRPRRSRGRRAAMPSWDEIMFGARKQD